MRRQEIEINLEHSMLEGIISKKEYVRSYFDDDGSRTN
jgi:hypothetical protein